MVQTRRPGCPAGTQRGDVRHRCFLNLEANTDPSPSSPAIHHLSPAQSISRCPRGFRALHAKISQWQVIPALHSHPPHFTLPVILLPTHSLITASKCVPTSTPPELIKQHGRTGASTRIYFVQSQVSWVPMHTTAVTPN